MSDIIGNGKISGLIAYLENLSAKGKVKTSAITPLKSATKAVFSTVVGEHWQEIDVRSIDIDDYINRFKNLTIGKYDSNSYNAYRARVSRVINWYNNFLQDPGWYPTVKDRPRDAKKNKTVSQSASMTHSVNDISKNETASTVYHAAEQAHISEPQHVSTRLISFPFPMSNGVIATLYLPQSISPNDANRLQDFIKALVIDDGQSHETV